MYFSSIFRSISPQKNRWSLPGGFVQGDETLEEAARRIFVNETGISPAYLSQFRSYSDTKRDKRVVNQRSGQKARVVTTAFTAIYTSDEELQLDEESEDISEVWRHAAPHGSRDQGDVVQPGSS